MNSQYDLCTLSRRYSHLTVPCHLLVVDKPRGIGLVEL